MKTTLDLFLESNRVHTFSLYNEVIHDVPYNDEEVQSLLQDIDSTLGRNIAALDINR
jgi:hypothetical protein